MLISLSCNQEKEEDEIFFPNLTGPYLGKKPPGKTPEVFASGIISTGKNESYLIVICHNKKF